MFLNNEDLPLPDLSRVVFPNGTRYRILAMFVAYFDESGTQRDSPIVVVGGFLAPDKQWSRLQAEWTKVLQQEKISFFHATDWENRQGQFKGWDNDRRIGVYKKLVGIIQRRITIPVLAAVRTADYKEAKLWEAVVEMWPKSPYGFCAFVCMRIIGHWAEEVRHNDPIAYVFEDGAAHKADLTTSHTSIFADDENRRLLKFISLTYADKKQFAPLQAADALAYEGYKDMRNQTVEGHARRQRISFQALLDRMRLNYKSIRFYSKEDLFKIKHGRRR
jgi:hypothetical protein